ncbi:MAG: VCBS repeat-containing protein, partial [Acidobacteriota bacterium]
MPFVAIVLIAMPIVGSESASVDASAPSQSPRMAFEEIGEAAGVRFVHSPRSFAGRHKHQVLEMFTDGGAAAAAGDFDADGDDDLFVVDSDLGTSHHLMRNDGVRDGIPRFTEITASAGVGGGNDEHSIVADALWFDHDNDGRLDLLLGRFGTPVLWRNLGPDADGVWRFDDISESAGLVAFANTIGMIAFDADRDGWLDLMLANYFQPVNLLALETTKILPDNLDNATNGGGVSFWHNVAGPEGGRRFVDRTQAAGFADHTGWSLDIGHADLDNDGDQDVYIAGDYGTDRLFLNDGVAEDGTPR